MPHPVHEAVAAAAPPPSPPDSPPTTQPQLQQPFANHLLAQGHAFATHSFRSQAASVLQHASTTCLRRLLSQRVRNHMGQLSQEQLRSDSSVEELLSLDPSLMRVSEEDIQKCYGVAERVGNKWADVLKRQGYHEFANVAFDVVKRSRFLEPPGDASPTTQEDADNDKPKPTKKCASAFTGLNALRRYPADCDGSGLPSKYLHDPDHNDQSSARKLIQQIDQMAHDGQSNWHHGWDAVEEAARRNDKRMEYSRARSMVEQEYDIVPKEEYESMLLQCDNGDSAEEEDKAVEDGNSKPSKKRSRSSDRKKTVQFKDDDEDMAKYNGKSRGREADVDFLLSTNKKASLILKRRRRKKVEDDDLDEEGGEKPDNLQTKVYERGRPPSSIGDTTLSWDDMLKSMSMEERQKLIMSSIHPPYPFESDMKDGTSNRDEGPVEPAHNAVLCGALKSLGQIHLWEQTHQAPQIENDGNAADYEEHNPSEGRKEIIYGASEARATFQSDQQKTIQKRAQNRAAKERLGRRTEIIKEINPEYTKLVKWTKVKWTEDDAMAQCGKGTAESSGSVKDLSLPQGNNDQSDGRQRKWLEMDLGECMVELVHDNEGTEDSARGGKDDQSETTKRFVSFRSLEVALMD